MSALRAIAPIEGPSLADPGPIELESVDCLLCGGEDFDTVLIAPDPVTRLGGNFRVVRCRRCQLTFTNPRPTPACIGRFYPDDYEPHRGRPWNGGLRARFGRRLERAVLETHFGFPATQPAWRRSVLAGLGLRKFARSRQRQSWIPWRAPGRLLDFGCGAGNFLREMQAFGWTVQGLDFSPHVAREVTERTGIPVHVGTLPHADVRPASFDAVTMWNSLEHVHSPRETVRAAGEALRRGGVLVVGVPNFDSWGYRTFRDDWHGLELPRHLTHFTPETLRDVLEREGYRVLSLDHVARVGWIRRSARRAAQRSHTPGWVRSCRFKSIGLRVADWTERTRQADFLRAVAEKQ